MTSKDIIRRCLRFEGPERIGLDFNAPHGSDMYFKMATELKGDALCRGWGRDAELLRKVPGFGGEVMADEWGVIYGRLDSATKGESIKGPLGDGWDGLERYAIPELNPEYHDGIGGDLGKHADKFVVGVMPCSPFATMRELRGMDNLFVDLLLCEDKVLELSGRIEELMSRIIGACAGRGFDGVVIYEDWGVQNALLISPALWRRIFKPVYRRLIDLAHSNGMAFLIHSCGYVYDIIGDFIEIGADALQFDQPELVGIERLSCEFGGKVAFWCPVDIQKVMVTGNRGLIEASASKMIDRFGRFRGGFIAKDYPQWDAIAVREEWAQWARDVFLREGAG